MLKNQSKTKAKGTSIQSVERVLDILELLAKQNTALGVSDIARSIDLKIPTTHNLLRTLFSRGYVTQEDGGQRYRLGYPCARLGWAYQQKVQLNDIYKPVIMELAGQLHSPIYIALAESGSFFFSTSVNASKGISPHYTEVWSEIHYESICTRVFLTYLDEYEQKAYQARYPFKKFGCDDLRNSKDLEKFIKQCKKQGYLAYERHNHTQFAVGVPVFDFKNQVVAALSMAFPLHKTLDKSAIIAAVTQAAQKISAELGGLPIKP